MNNYQRRLRESGRPVFSDDEYRDIVLLWMLRILGRTSARQGYLQKRSSHDSISSFIECDIEWKTENREAWNQWLDERLQAHEARSVAYTGILFENIRNLSTTLGLTPVEQEILAFRTLYRTNEALYELIETQMGPLTDSSLTRMLGVALGRSPIEIFEALSAESALLRSGLIRLDPAIAEFREKMWAMMGLLNALLRAHRSTEDLIAFATHPAAAPTLAREDFPHHEKDLGLLTCYLATAREKALGGVNVLIHGKPGVGKTEFVRLIAQELGMTLYEVNMTNEAGLACTPQERYNAYLFNQRFFAADPKTLILFDEIEDVIPRPSRMADSSSTLGYDKAWVNRLLETNAVPAFWVANRIEHMDPAYLRRFDYVLEMRNPPRSVRRRMASRYLNDLAVSEAWLERQADREDLAPALMEKAARVVHHAGLSRAEEVERQFDRITLNSLEAQGSLSKAHYPVPAHYHLEYLNTSVDVKNLPSSLKQVRSGRILLHGAPGTGKTAFAHYLATALDRPLVVRRASDLQSMWVGEAEKNIARMFRDAAAEDTVLLLDEADSFLQDRKQAMRSWEISQVNELLTQMECYNGIFLCATNFMDHLDAASLRRFGLKIKFDYMTFDQRVAMFEGMFNSSGSILPSETELSKATQELRQFTNLTPGDFVTVRGRLELLGRPLDAGNLLEGLREESQIKPGGSVRKIGFAA